MAGLPPSDSLTEKTDAQLLFLAQHSELYHADLITAARRELRRRGISPDPAPPEPLPRETYILPYAEEAEPAFWQRPVAWVSLLAVLLIGGLLYWNSQQSKVAQQALAAQQADDKPIELESVETHTIPTFDSLTRTQVAQQMRQLTSAERTEDTSATRRYRILATRYWNAENQSTYLFDKLRDPANLSMAMQAPVVIEEWRRLTKALVYDLKLTPVLAERMNLMRRAAYLRIETLQGVSVNARNFHPALTPDIVVLRDSATHIRESLLSREQQKSQMRRMVLETL